MNTEQKLEQAALKEYEPNLNCQGDDSEYYERLAFIKGAKSEAARNYHLSELRKLELNLTQQFDSDVRVGLALLEEIRKIKL